MLLSSTTNSIYKEYDSITKRGKDREPVTCQVGDVIHDFRCTVVRPVPELSLTAYEFKHIRTNADYIHLDTADTDNTFSITFRTPCTNDTGVSHILEHTTLCGSEKYPVHDPFMKMRDRSLQTFMNAMTFDDHTSYPVSSTIPRDLLNLMDVYCDAVFHPLLRLADFRQEGWRLEDGHVKGVVFNEMKGYQSDQGRSLFQAVCSSFLKNTNYQYVSGGDPVAIPSLKYPDLLEFHHQHYHPSNCLFFSYGDIHPSHHMRFLNELILDRFKVNPNSTHIQVQTLPDTFLKSPLAHHTCSCPIDNSHVSNVWHFMKVYPTNITSDSSDIVKLQVLSMLLSRGQASPLYKALVESGLVQLLSPLQGYNTFSKNSFMCIGGNGIDASVTEEHIDEVIQKTLEDVVRNGFDNERIAGLLNEMELMYKQIKTMLGLVLMQSVTEAWTHNADPTVCLQSETELATMKKQGVNTVMKSMIDKYLLPKSDHGVHSIVVTPDDHFFDKQKEREEAMTKKLLETYPNGLPEYGTDINPHIFAKEEDDSILPTLSSSDIPKKHSIPSPIVYQSSSSIPIHYVETTTNHIVYPRLLFNLDCMESQRDLLNLPILLFLLNRMDTERYTAEQLETMESQCCGGLHMGVSVNDQFHGDLTKYRNTISVSSTILMQNGNLERVGDIMRSKCSEATLLKSIDRIQVLLESLVASTAMDFDKSLPSFNLRRSLTRRSMSSYIDDCYCGYQHANHILSLKSVVNDRQRLTEYVEHELEPLYRRVFNRQNMEVFLTVDSATAKEALNWADHIHTIIPSQSNSSKQSTYRFGKKENDNWIHVTEDTWERIQSESKFESHKNVFTISPIDTNHIVSHVQSISMNERDYDSVYVLSQILSSKFLLKHIREEGGAYGTNAMHSSGYALFSSYDDPNVLRSIDQFVKGCEWIRNGEFSEKDIVEARLSLFGDIDAPREPQTLGFDEVMSGKTSQLRQEQRDLLLNVTKDQLMDMAKKVYGMESSMQTFVFGNKHSVKEVENKDNWVIDTLASSLCSTNRIRKLGY